MKFSITRTSAQWIDAPKPCEEAVLESRYLCAKDGDYELWNNEYRIEIDSLQELVDLTKKYGEIIINGNSLEIYDDYRE